MREHSGVGFVRIPAIIAIVDLGPDGILEGIAPMSKGACDAGE